MNHEHDHHEHHKPTMSKTTSSSHSMHGMAVCIQRISEVKNKTNIRICLDDFSWWNKRTDFIQTVGC